VGEDTAIVFSDLKSGYLSIKVRWVAGWHERKCTSLAWIGSLTGKGQAGGSSNGIGLPREARYPGLADVEQLVELVVDGDRHRACHGRRPPWLRRRW
jgi:hypothetical protein